MAGVDLELAAVEQATVGMTGAQKLLLLRHEEAIDQLADARRDPAVLLNEVQCVDAKTGERFDFQLTDEAEGWYWQRELLDWWQNTDKTVVLKARQLGITWLAAGLGLWYLLMKPGSRILVVSINEEEASKVVNRIWDMLESLPLFLRNQTTVLKPSKGARPYKDIILHHPDGRTSSVLGLPSTKRAGHGETAALVLLDEFSRQEYARETWKAVLPTMAGGGRVLVISTANGVSNEQSGEGNFFHHLWVSSDQYGIQSRFLPWQLHPDRDQQWYSDFAMALPARDRAEQFPADEHEAFILTGDLYFDNEALAEYAKERVLEPLYRADFKPTTPLGDRAKLVKQDDGLLRVYQEPEDDRTYAVGVDVATGKGYDSSCAYVVDLTDLSLVAELHGRVDADRLAFQLHYLGRWYHTPVIAIETGGGYGEAPIVFLRDGKDGRPPYPRLYRHRQESRSDHVEHKPYGYPMNTKTRPLVLENLERALRERAIPAVPHGLLSELQTFVYRDTNPSPRAQEGCSDDRVFACAITVELYRQYGAHAPRPRRKRARERLVEYPWMER